MPEEVVIVVGAGPSGLAAAACLTRLSIPYLILEREDCYASLWKKKAYDRLHLHLAKPLCQLPHMEIPADWPKYPSGQQYVQYLDNYADHFGIHPLYRRYVESGSFDESKKKWNVLVRNGESGELEEYSGRFLVVASGETSDAFVPEIDGLNTFTGRIIHSTQYKSGKEYADMNVLVVGSGNSGMEIALDLSNYGAKTSIVVRSQVIENKNEKKKTILHVLRILMSKISVFTSLTEYAWFMFI